jgi:starvation-inducible DNA-binding protein
MNLEIRLKAKQAFADSFLFYLKAHYFHWNVEGRHFSQDHELLGKIYEEVYGALDKFAEEIRTLDTYAPGIFNRFMNLSNIEQKGQIPSAEEMYSELMQDNQKVISNLTLLFDMLEDLKLYGFADFIGERIDAHNKHQWMLRSTLK